MKKEYKPVVIPAHVSKEAEEAIIAACQMQGVEFVIESKITS